jgi:hypothetical protein
MGLDGGTIITRSDVLRGQSWDVAQADTSRSTRGGSVNFRTSAPRADAADERAAKWTTCALSGEELSAPVVADRLGRLYNKAAILELLLARRGAFIDDQSGLHRHLNLLAGGADVDHLASIRSVFEVRLPPDGACPVTQARLGAGSFVALASCGDLLSERAVKGLGGCPACGAAFAANDVVPVNGPVTAELRHQAMDASRDDGPRRKKQRKSDGKATDTRT